MRRHVIMLSLCACAHTGSGDRGSRIGPPKVDRCAAQAPTNQPACRAARDAAVAFAQKLFTDDQICLDGEHELSDTSQACHVRAFVEGAAPNAVELEIRDAPGNSRFELDADWWFAHQALADLQLRALGYALTDDVKGR